MKLIKLSRGLFTKVDSDIFEKYGHLTWTAQKRIHGFHAARYFGKKYIYLHTLVLPVEKGFEVHHKNDDGLDNRRENLEAVTRTRHRQSDLKRRRDNTSGYRGVWYSTQMECYVAEIMHNKKKRHLGSYVVAEDAARERDRIARELGWPESGMNFPK